MYCCSLTRIIAMRSKRRQEGRQHSVRPPANRKQFGCNFGFPAAVSRPHLRDYFARHEEVHVDIGSAFRRGDFRGWPNVCPTRDRGIWIVAPDMVASAGFACDVLRVLIANGRSCFSLAAYPVPRLLAGARADAAFSPWPAVLWQAAHRGDLRTPHSDVGVMELFGGFWVAQFAVEFLELGCGRPTLSGSGCSPRWA